MDRVREPLPTRVEATPALPPAYVHAIEAGLHDLGLALPADARTTIDGHVRLLLAWTGAINLTAIRDPVAVAERHVIDSLTGVAVLRDLGAERFLDLGSGGGLPGIPLAAAIPAEARLVESIGKKADFLEVATTAIGLAGRVRVARDRAESLAHDRRERGAWPVVTARAVGALGELVELALPLLIDGGSLIAWKRGELTAELRAAQGALTALGGGSIRVVEPAVRSLPGHRLVVVTRTGRVPDAFPRDPAVRRRRPW